jgi:hypothetical protein
MQHILSVVLLGSTLIGGLTGGGVDNWGNDIPGIVTNEVWMTPQPTYTEGKAVFFGPYAMDATAEYRGIDYEQEGCLGGVSLMSPIDIGSKVWVKFEGSQWYGPFCAVDCARRGDMYSIVVIREEVIEINFELAVEIGMVSQHDKGVYEVYDWFRRAQVIIGQKPMDYFADCEDEACFDPVNYRNHFLDHVEFAPYREPRVMPYRKSRTVWKEYGTQRYWIKDVGLVDGAGSKLRDQMQK